LRSKTKTRASRNNGFSRGDSATNGSLFDPDVVQQLGIWDADDLITSGECFFCGSKDSHEAAIRKDGLVIKECSNCGLAFVDPRPSPVQLAQYYDSGYFNGAKDFFHGKDYCLERDKSIRTGAVTGYQEIVANFDVAGKTVLDVGCASGALLCLLRGRKAKEVVGIDTAEYPVSFGVKQYGLDLRLVALERAGLPDAYFDLITLIDVIEHVENLKAFLTELRRVLKPGGSIFIITPNYQAYQLARAKWICLYKDFEHLQYLTRKSLGVVCNEHNLHLVKCWTDSLPFMAEQYSRLRSHRAHRLSQPNVALMNAWAKIRFNLAGSDKPSLGLSLNAVVKG
jgi:2-polyprenyl-3-methyl-5-hydroxy-6-metoxy-1,4-benzoquinol methylase